MDMTALISVGVLIGSGMLHEIMHAFVADRLGDPTPRTEHRLTLNPLRHFDIVGSVIIPGVLMLLRSSMLLAWAKPVAFDIKRFEGSTWGRALVGLIGPMTNITLALLFGILLRYSDVFGITSPFAKSLFAMFALFNISLAIFNIIPIPPLDGHHALYSFLNFKHNEKTLRFLEKYGIFLFIGVLYFLWSYLTPVVDFLFMLLTGSL
jgi:Zn-dependent protease